MSMALGLGIFAIAGAVTSIMAGSKMAKAAKRAAAAKERAERESIANQEKQKVANRADQDLNITLGQRASAQLAGVDDAVDANGNPITPLDRKFNNEGDDFLVAEGKRAIEQGLAAKGQVFAGAALEAIGRNETEIRTAGVQREYNVLNTIADRGTQSASDVGALNTNLTAQTSAALSEIGSQNAQSQLDRGNAKAGAILGVGGAIGGAALLGGATGAFQNAPPKTYANVL